MEGIELLRLKNDKTMQQELWMSWLPQEMLRLSEELSFVDKILSDERFFEPFRERFNTRTGRPTVPVEVYVRLMYLKARYGLGYETLVKEVSDSISWRVFCKISLSEKVPDATTLIKLTKKYGDIVEELNRLLLEKAKEEKVIRSRKVRVDTTVVEANIHYPTDASLIADGIRKVTKEMQEAQELGVSKGEKVVDRTRSVKKRLARIGNIVRGRAKQKMQEIDEVTKELIGLGKAVLKRARVILQECLVEPAGKAISRGLNGSLCLLERVIAQAEEVVSGNRQIEDRVVSLHDPGARPIKKGSVRNPVQFGRKLGLCESAEGFITAYEVYDGNPSDQRVLIDIVQKHIQSFGGVPVAISADKGMGSRQNELLLSELGIKRVCLPSRGRKSQERRLYERTSWFRRLKKWRSGIEARISTLKRKYGLRRSFFDGNKGTKVWAGLGIFAHNIDRFALLALKG